MAEHQNLNISVNESDPAGSSPFSPDLPGPNVGSPIPGMPSVGPHGVESPSPSASTAETTFDHLYEEVIAALESDDRSPEQAALIRRVADSMSLSSEPTRNESGQYHLNRHYFLPDSQAGAPVSIDPRVGAQLAQWQTKDASSAAVYRRMTISLDGKEGTEPVEMTQERWDEIKGTVRLMKAVSAKTLHLDMGLTEQQALAAFHQLQTEGIVDVKYTKGLGFKVHPSERPNLPEASTERRSIVASLLATKVGRPVAQQLRETATVYKGRAKKYSGADAIQSRKDKQAAQARKPEDARRTRLNQRQQWEEGVAVPLRIVETPAPTAPEAETKKASLWEEVIGFVGGENKEGDEKGVPLATVTEAQIAGYLVEKSALYTKVLRDVGLESVDIQNLTDEQRTQMEQIRNDIMVLEEPWAKMYTNRLLEGGAIKPRSVRYKKGVGIRTFSVNAAGLSSLREAPKSGKAAETLAQQPQETPAVADRIQADKAKERQEAVLRFVHDPKYAEFFKPSWLIKEVDGAISKEVKRIKREVREENGNKPLHPEVFSEMEKRQAEARLRVIREIIGEDEPQELVEAIEIQRRSAVGDARNNGAQNDWRDQQGPRGGSQSRRS